MTQRVLNCGGGILKRWRGYLLNTQRSYSSSEPAGDSGTQPDKQASSVTQTQISKLLTRRSRDDQDKLLGNQPRKLVLLFDWLYAKPAAVERYCDLYHARGLDVLTVNGRLVHFLWPPEGYKLAKEILAYLDTTEEDLIVHAFSVGAYIYTLCLMLAQREPEKFGHFRDRVKGQIFDSVVIGSYDHMSTGMTVALPGNNVMKKPILKVMDTYYNMTKQSTRDEFDRLVDLFKSQPIMVPTLLFYSYNDPMCYVPAMEEMIENWRRNLPDFDVKGKCWEDSIHAAHLKFHTEEYLESWNELMAKIN